MRAKQKFKLSATIIGICFLLHGIPVFAAESSEMIEFDLKTNEMKTVEIEEQNSDSVDSYIPEGISTGIQTYGAIIDGDDRYRIPANLSSTTFPYCSWLSFPSRYRFTAYVLSSTDTFLLDIKYAESKGFFDFKAERELYSIVKAW